MTDKRFQWVAEINGNYVDEYVKDTITDKGLDEEDMCNLLNTLYEENEQLKKALTELKEIGDYQAMRIKELQE